MDRLLWTSSRLAPLSSCQTRLSKCSRSAPFNLFPAESPGLVGCHQLAAGQFQSTGFLADPLTIFPSGVCLSAACGLVPLGWFPPVGPSVLVPARFLSTTWMCASRLCSCMFLLHDFLLTHFTFIPAGFPPQMPLIPVLVRVRIRSAALG